MALRKTLAAALALSGAALSACGHDQVTGRLGAGYGLFFNDQGQSVALAYGLANSDDVALMLQCAKGSGRVQVSDSVRDKPAAKMTLASDGRKTVVPLKVETGESGGPRILSGSVSMDAEALKAFRQSGRIRVAYDHTGYALEATEAERAGVERFFTACRRA